MKNNVSVVVLNWNSPDDTIECLKSILLSNFENCSAQIIIVDNKSSDNSVNKISKFLIELQSKPSIEERGGINEELGYTVLSTSHLQREIECVFIQSHRNGGYAAGNNIGIKYSLENYDPKFIWILNNDTKVTECTFQRLNAKMEGDQEIGICGATILKMHSPKIVETIGGFNYSKWSGRGFAIHGGRNFEISQVKELKIGQIDYIYGASMFVRTKFIRRIGLMDERYFLYCEELDWSLRGGQYFKIDVASDAIVYHKGGATSGSTTSNGYPSISSAYYMSRAKLLLARKFFSYAQIACTVAFQILFAMRLILFGQFKLSFSVFRGILAGLTAKFPANNL
jgi:GT2 family glycosyltransferase